MSIDQPDGGETGRSGRAPRVGDSRSPVGSTLSIVLAIVAVVAGFLILRTLSDDDGDDTADPSGETDGTGVDPGISFPNGTTVTTVSTPTTQPQLIKTGATIAVANASGVDGSASQMSTALTTAGYAGVGEPGNGTGNDITASIVYYVNGNAAAQQVANSIARELRVAAAQPMPDPRPVAAGSTGTATVLVLLGSDQAGKPIPGVATATPPQVTTTTT